MKILILSEFYLDDTNANGHCARMLVRGLRENKIDVDVVCVKDPNYELTELDRQDMSLYVIDNLDIKSKSSKNKIKRMQLIMNWPLEKPKTADEIIKGARKLISQNHYNGILAIHKSYVSVYCAFALKKMYKNIKVIVYLLDPIANQIDKYLGLRKHLFTIVKMREQAVYRKADALICMKCNAGDHINQKYKSKVKYADFPLITSEELIRRRIEIKAIDPRKVRMIYFGTVNSIYRSPNYLLNLLIKALKTENIEVFFYCQGDCIDEMRKIVSEYKDIIHINGYLSRAELAKEVKKSDIVINIGNAMSNMVPSKIFDVILYGKPILSISKQKIDSSDIYLKKYGAALIIKENDDLDTSMENLLKFINSYKNGKVRYADKIDSLFAENTPAFSAEIIRKIMNAQ